MNQINQQINQMEKIKEAALRLLERQDRTAAELRDRLLGKGFEEEAVEETVSGFIENGLINDTRYAELYAQSKLQSGRGSRWIKQKLRQKGIADGTIDSTLAGLRESDEIEDESVLCLRRALAICGLSGMFEIDENGEAVPCDTYEYSQPLDYFGRRYKINESEPEDRSLMRREREKAKASLTRRLMSAGFPAGAVFSAVRTIEKL